MNSNRLVRCLLCREEFGEDNVYDESCCPVCGTDLQPEYPDLDVTVTLNWDSLRLLANWSQQWAATNIPDADDSARREFEIVLKRLREVRPEDGEPLTLDDTLSELENLHGIKLTDPEQVARIELTPKKKNKPKLVN